MPISRRGLSAAAVGAGLGLSPWARTVDAAAPMLGPARASFHRIRLGRFEVTMLLDGAVTLDGPYPIFGEDQAAADVRAQAEARFLPTDLMEITFAPLLVNTGDALVLFDTGNAVSRAPAAANLGAALRDAGYTPEQVDIVVLTHFHPDHIGGLARDGVATYPSARIVTHEAEYRFWSAEERLQGGTANTARLTQQNVVPLNDRLTFIEDGEDVVTGITAMAAHGHTPGHMVYHLESDGRRLLIWGDTANHYAMSVERPDWHVRFDMDKDAAVATRRRILDLAATERLAVTGYHMPFPALGYIDRTEAGYRWMAATYQLNF